MSWLSSLLTGWKVVVHHFLTTTDFLGAFAQVSAVSVPLFITSKAALPMPCCFTLWGVNPMSLKWQQ